MSKQNVTPETTKAANAANATNEPNPSSENTALATQPQAGYLQLADMDFGNDILAEMNGLDLTFEKVKNPIGGGVMFEVPGEDGEPEPVKEISGVILYHHPVYMRYDQKYTGGNNPPDCGSFDGKTGKGNPGGDCKTCKYNQFGTTAKGKTVSKRKYWSDRTLIHILENPTYIGKYIASRYTTASY
jgi:hypothetical protein